MASDSRPRDKAVIIRFNPATKAETVVFTDHLTYDIETFAVTPGGELTVSARRKSDNGGVMGKVNAQGSLDVTLNFMANKIVPVY
jgi:hypothetical protein